MRKIFLLLPVILILGFSADDTALNTLLAKLDRLRRDYPQEKVHLHFDKPYYSLGDDVWFKAYVVNAEKNELSVLSRVLYVDLIDDKDSLRKTVILPLTNGLAQGDIKLVDSIFDAGNYHLRAYTRWMQNFSQDFMFNKSLTIGDALTPSSVIANARFQINEQNADRRLSAEVSYTNLADQSPLPAKPVSYELLYKGKPVARGKTQTNQDGKAQVSLSIKKDYDVSDLKLQTAIAVNSTVEAERMFNIVNSQLKTSLQFFPEGGYLVNGLRSKVAFKALKPDGTGADVTGYIVDEGNNRVAEFKSEHAGMGFFALQPTTGGKYVAILENTSGGQERYALPDVRPEGLVLSINHLQDSITLRVSATSAMVKGEELSLVAQQNGAVKYVTKFKMEQPVISARFDKSRFGTGIVQFTLFAPDLSPIAERLMFIDKHDQLNLSVSTTKSSYGRREKVETTMNVTDSNGKPVEANFSVAVVDKGKVQFDDDDETTILSNLLLTSDLKGYVESPNYYFNNVTADKVRQLDQLMLTQGWSRFKWDDLKVDKYPPLASKPQQSIEVTGKITSMFNKPMPKAKVTLFASTAQGPLLIDTVADEFGNFVFDNLEISGDVKYVVRAKNARDRNNVRIVLDKPAKPGNGYYHAVKDGLESTSTLAYLRNTQKRFEELSRNGLMDKSIMLKEVRIKQKGYLERNKVAGSAIIGGGPADLVIGKEKLKNYTNALHAFYGLPGLEIKNDMVYRVGRTISLTRSGGVPMTVLLNGFPIEANMLKDIPPDAIEGIEVLKSGAATAVYGDMGYWGIILITMKKGGSDGSGFNPTYLRKMTVNGYAEQREFYSPAYDHPTEKEKGIDMRSTIYWQPNVVTNADGKASISYFTGDEPGTYLITAEGINIDGKLARETFTYTVK